MGKICVVGSSNYDMMAYTTKLPRPGETLIGKTFETGFGGKGANQACISAKLGSKVTMVTKLGNDVFGKDTLENYKSLNINTNYVTFTNKASSGVAPITVDDNSENCIVVIPGANNILSIEDIEDAKNAIIESKVLMTQCEIRNEVTIHAMKIAKENGVMTVFNPAPMPTEEEFFKIIKYLDILIVNEIEASSILKCDVANIEYIKNELKILGFKYNCAVILTLGKNGAIYINSDMIIEVPGVNVNAVDTTGAGDCFIGSFAHFISSGLEIDKALKNATLVAALSVTKKGTQKSFPTIEEVKKFEEERCL